MVLNAGKKKRKMKLAIMKQINKMACLIIFILIYTYIIIFFTTAQMLKITSTNDIVSYTTMQMVMEANKSIESFLNFKIKSSIDLSEQKYSIFSNPMDIYYILSISDDMERVCSSIFKNSSNVDIKEFRQKNCNIDNKCVAPEAIGTCEARKRQIISEIGAEISHIMGQTVPTPKIPKPPRF
jgi:hypothetical protein